MDKIIVFENSGILGLKINKILKAHNFDNVEIISDYNKVKITQSTFWEGVIGIVLDLDNRNQDAVQLATNLSANQVTTQIPIIVLSESVSLAKLKRVIAAGSRVFILKPFEAQTLINKLYDACYQNKKTQEIIIDASLNQIFGEDVTPLSWSKEFEIGIKQIDSEHKSIVDSYEKLYQMTRAGQGQEYFEEMCELLSNYIITHFEHEEKLQQNIGYVEYEYHKGLHVQFKNRVEEIIGCYQGKDISNEELVRFTLIIQDWLLHHILVEDMKIKNFISSSN